MQKSSVSCAGPVKNSCAFAFPDHEEVGEKERHLGWSVWFWLFDPAGSKITARMPEPSNASESTG